MSALDDEAVNERATGRLFGLSDAVFAIAMTLLALNLHVPALGAHPDEQALEHALAEQGPHYVSFLLSFYVIAIYWRRQHAEMRTIHTIRTELVRLTMFLLLMVSSLPFAAGLLGAYGGESGIAVAVYSGVNVLAVGTLLLIRYETRRHRLASDTRPTPGSHELWFDLVALLLAAPSGYLLPGHGVLSLVVLLTVSGLAGRFLTRRHARRKAPWPMS
ncbi:TMEM175 family protein [Streptomyces sp. NPDC051569]|uniref:TMEM175 family protein n=1 Tax=Streptomyces sp. NPDC051569 TaxID=3365661 RepID=UPI0037B3CB69